MRLWTHDFIRMYLSNLLLFASLYMLLPILPMYLVERFNTTLTIAGGVSASFAIAIFFFGPFYSYLIDTFRRKNVCILSYLTIIAILFGYTIVGSLLWVIVLRMAQGALFGVATTMGSTLAIDITNTARRSEANICFSWAARLGMVIGAMSGLLLYRYAGLQEVIYGSLAAGILGLILVSLIHVAFRAPIGTSLCSSDRFLLPHGWIPAFNLVLISFVFGMLLTSINMYTESIQMQEVTVRFFILLTGGFVLAMIANRTAFENADIRAKIVSGLVLTGASLLLIITYAQSVALMTAAVLMGLGIGLTASNFLLVFVKLSEHCQRGTANTMYLLAWEVGIAIGVATGCYLIDISSYISVFQVGIVAVIFSLGIYLGITNPYFQKHKVR